MSSRPYAHKAWEVLVNLASAKGAAEHPLLEKRDEINSIDIILVTSDRSLCGSYNDNIIRLAERFAAHHRKKGQAIRWIPVGRKGADFLTRTRQEIVAEFSNLPTPLGYSDVLPIGKLVIEDYLAHAADGLFIAYTDFVNTLVQHPTVINLLPLQRYKAIDGDEETIVKKEPDVTTGGRDYIYEPTATALLDEVVPRFTILEIYHALLESLASEHSARMIAMRNASENANALADDLTLEYNKARQSAITAEILDIVGGVNALETGRQRANPDQVQDILSAE